MLSTAECSEFRQRIEDGSVDITYQSNVASMLFKSNRYHGNCIVSCKIVIKWLFSRTFGSYESFTNISNNVDKMFVRVATSHWLILLYSHGVHDTRKNIWPKNEWQSGRYCNRRSQSSINGLREKMYRMINMKRKMRFKPVAINDWIRGYSTVSAAADSTVVELKLNVLAVAHVLVQTHYRNSRHTNRKCYLELDHWLEMCPTWIECNQWTMSKAYVRSSNTNRSTAIESVCWTDVSNWLVDLAYFGDSMGITTARTFRRHSAKSSRSLKGM